MIPFPYQTGQLGRAVAFDLIRFQQFLLHFDGTDGATTTVDSSPKARTVTLNGGAQLSTAQAKFGASSLLVTTGANRNASMAGNSDFDQGTGDFTIRVWAYKTANGANGQYRRIFQTASADVVCGLSLSDNRATTGNLSWSVSTNGTTQNIVTDADVGTLALNTWTHFSIEQFGGRMMLYIDGTRISDVSMGGVKPFYNASFAWTFGGNSTGAVRTFNGHIDEAEYYKGIALAGGAASFTVPTAPSLP